MNSAITRLLTLVLLALLLLVAPAAHAATFTVSSPADSADATAGDGVCDDGTGRCTLRAAIMEANAWPGTDTLSVPSGTYLLTVLGTGDDVALSGDLDITETVTIAGAGSSATIVDGNATDRVFDVHAGVAADISGVTVRNGSVAKGAGIRTIAALTLSNVVLTGNVGSADGGALNGDGSAASVTLSDCVIHTNQAKNGGGMFFRATTGSLSFTNVTVRDNTATATGGGAVFNGAVGSTIFEGVTFSGNSAVDGGGILFKTSTTPILRNVTVSGNTATNTGGGIRIESGAVSLYNLTIFANTAPAGKGAGIHQSGGTIQPVNTIVANSITGNDCIGTITSNGYNLDSDGTCGFASAGDTSGVDPLLGLLQDNGGPTQTHMPQTGSPAIDTGTATGAPATDQRGVARPIDGDGDTLTDYDKGSVEATTPSTPAAAPTISSAGNQFFYANYPSVANSTVTISEDADSASITALNDIRVRIPAGFGMKWDGTDLTATIGGSAAGKVSTAVTFEDGDATLVLNVTTDFAPSDQITISNLSFTLFSGSSPADSLDLEVFNDGVVTATDDKTISVARSVIQSLTKQFFFVGQDPGPVAPITISDDAYNPLITAGTDIRIVIPPVLTMSWDVSDLSATIAGSAAAKVSSTVSYENGGKTLVLDVLVNFGVADTIVVSDVSFANFISPVSKEKLELDVLNDGITNDIDGRDITIDPAHIISSAANQVFSTGDPPTPISPITIVASSAKGKITAADGLRVRIPAGFNMDWDVADLTAIVGGPAAAKVSNTVGYEDGGKTLVLNVLSDFAAGDSVTISGMSFLNFIANSLADNLEMEVKNDGVASAFDDKTIAIGNVSDLQITKTVNDPTPNESDSLTYTVIVMNNGPDTATNVVVGDTLQAGLTYVLDATTQGAYASGTGLWTVGSIASGASDTLTLTATVDPGTGGSTIQNTASVSASDQADPTSANNTNAVTVTVLYELSIIKRAFLPDGTPLPDGAPVPKGTHVKFLMYINNPGPLRSDVSITDALGTSFAYQSGTIKIDNSVTDCVADSCTSSEESTIFSSVDTMGSSTDVVDGDVVSYNAGTSTVAAGNQVAGNMQLDVLEAAVWAILFEVIIQ